MVPFEAKSLKLDWQTCDSLRTQTPYTHIECSEKKKKKKMYEMNLFDNWKWNLSNGTNRKSEMSSLSMSFIERTKNNENRKKERVSSASCHMFHYKLK